MYVCICNAITDSQIREAAESGVKDLPGLERALGVAAGCVSCKETAADILRASRRRHQVSGPVVYQPALA